MSDAAARLPDTHRIQAPASGPGGSLARRLERGARWAVVLLAVFGAVEALLAYRGYASEDAFITYRYAQNLAAGNGFVFNPGERVLGTSTPLYALLLAIPGALGLDVATAGAALFAASLGAVALLGGGLLLRAGHPLLAVLYATLAVWASGDLLFFFGMETPFYVALLLGAFRCALSGREVAAGLLVGLAFLTRHDGVLFAAALFLLLWLRERRLPWRGALLSAAVVAPWLVFATLYFGSPIPNTLTAKAGEIGLLQYMREAAIRQMWSFYSPVFLFVPAWRVPPVVVALSTAALLAPLALAGRRLFARNLVVAQAVAFPLSLWLGYSIIGASPNFAWYLVPAAYFLALGALLAWGGVVEARRLVVVRCLLAVALLAVTVAALPVKLRAQAESLQGSAFYRGRNEVYRTLARWIRDRDLADLTVLMDEPGCFAYHSGSPVIDAAGLITRGIYFTGPAERRTPGNVIIETYQPDLIIMPPVPWPVLEMGRYLPLYHPVPVRAVYVRRSVFRERFAELSRQWLARDAYHPGDEPPARHPLAWDFELGRDDGWDTGGDLGQHVGRPLALVYDRAPVEDDVLHTVGSRDLWGTVSSPPFLIDFDELSFRFAATHPLRTRARLLVDGQEVLVEGGGGAALELRDVRWPVSSWTGKIGVLQFHDADLEGGYLVADRVRSMRHERRVVLDDFEAETYGSRWQREGEATAPLARLAIEHGLGMLVGHRAALSRWGEPAELRSRPFRVEHDNLSFLVFDFGGAATRVELRVGGEVRREFTGAASRRLQPVVWRVRGLRGEQAELAVVDGAPGDDEWIGIDALTAFDEPGPAPPPRRRRP